MPDRARRSKLVPIGLTIVVLSFGVGSSFGGLMSGIFEFNPDVLFNLVRALFLVGLACLVTGIVRNRRWKRQFELGSVPRQ
jgi:hypothetical protein